jgi:hypothetical protein
MSSSFPCVVYWLCICVERWAQLVSEIADFQFDDFDMRPLLDPAGQGVDKFPRIDTAVF